MRQSSLFNPHSLEPELLVNKRKLYKTAASIKTTFPQYKTLPNQTSILQYRSFEKLKYIKKLTVSTDNLTGYKQLNQTLKSYHKRIGTLSAMENDVYHYSKEEEKILHGLYLNLQKRVSTIDNFLLNQRTIKNLNKIRSLNNIMILLDEFEQDPSLSGLIRKVSRLRNLRTIRVVSQDPERVSFLSQKLKESDIYKRGSPELAVIIPGWSGVMQEPLAIKNLINIQDLNFLSIVCYDGLSSFSQAFDLDSTSNIELSWLKLKVCPVFGGYSEEEEFLPTQLSTLKNLSNFSSIKKLDMVISPKGIFGRTPTKDLTNLLGSLAFPTGLNELCLSIQEITLDEEIQIEEITSSLLKILSPLSSLKSINLQLIFVGDVPSFFEQNFASLFERLTDLQQLKLAFKIPRSFCKIAFQAGEFLSKLSSHRKLSTIEIEAPSLSLAGFDEPKPGCLVNLRKLSLKAKNVCKLEGENEDNNLVNLLSSLVLKNIETLNLEFICSMGKNERKKIIEAFEKMQSIREVCIKMIWEDYSMAEKFLYAFSDKKCLKLLHIEFPRWMSGVKIPGVFFNVFRRGYFKNAQLLKLVTKHLRAIIPPITSTTAVEE